MSRIKHVFSDATEVAHIWAQQLPERIGEETRTPTGHCYVDHRDGKTIFSYGRHFPMATFLDAKTVAFTSRTYSATTSSHLWAVRSALRGLDVKIITVPHPLSTAQGQKTQVEDEIASLLDKASRARQRKDSYLAQALSISDNFNQFAAFKKERCRIKFRLGENGEMTNFLQDRVKRLQAEEKRAAAENKKRMERVAVEAAEAAEKWLTGLYAPMIYHYIGPTLLRLKDGEIETSRGARIPVSAAKRLWPMIEKVRASGVTTEFDMRVGNYTLDIIRADGSISVGCHDIAYDQIQRMSVALGLAEEVAV